MKLTGGRADRFVASPPDDILGVLLFGPDRGLVQERGQALVRQFVDDPDDAFSTTILTADDLTGDTAKLDDELSAMSLLGDQRLVRLRLDHERAGAAIAKIIKSFDANPRRCAAKLIVEAGDMTTRSAVRKAFEAAGHFASMGCYPANQADLGNLVRSELTALNIKIDPDALTLWVPLLEGDNALAKGEIEKMALYKGYGNEPSATVTIADVKILAAGGQSASIDDIVYAAMSGRMLECDETYRRAIAGKQSAASILFALQRHITQLLEATANMNAGDSTEGAMRSLRPPIFGMRQREFTAQLRRWPGLILQKALSQSIEAEMQLKTAGSPADAITGRLLLALASYAEKRN